MPSPRRPPPLSSASSWLSRHRMPTPRSAPARWPDTPVLATLSLVSAPSRALALSGVVTELTLFVISPPRLSIWPSRIPSRSFSPNTTPRLSTLNFFSSKLKKFKLMVKLQTLNNYNILIFAISNLKKGSGSFSEPTSPPVVPPVPRRSPSSTPSITPVRFYFFIFLLNVRAFIFETARVRHNQVLES